MPIVIDESKTSGWIWTMKVTGVKTVATESENDLIYQTYWELSGNILKCPICGESHTGVFNGATPLIHKDQNGALRLDQVDLSNVTPYEEVTEEMANDWISAQVDLVPFTRIIKQVNELHEKSKTNTPEDQGLPWPSNQQTKGSKL